MLLLQILSFLDKVSDENERLALLRRVVDTLREQVNFPAPASPRSPAPSFFARHPKIRVGLTLLIVGLVVFCDVFVGVATILSGVMTAGMIIFAISIGFAALLMGLILLLQLSSLTQTVQLSWLKPPKSIVFKMEERQILRELSQIMASVEFDRHYQEKHISEEAYQALTNMMQARIQATNAFAANLKKKNQSKLVVFCQTIALLLLGLSNTATGFTIGYFFAGALAICFQSLFIPVWLPLVLGSVLGLAFLSIFWDKQRQDVRQMVERGFGCDKNWIEAMTQDMMPSDCLALSRLSNGRPLCVAEVFFDQVYDDQGVTPTERFFADEKAARLQLIRDYSHEQQNYLPKELPALSV